MNSNPKKNQYRRYSLPTVNEVRFTYSWPSIGVDERNEMEMEIESNDGVRERHLVQVGYFRQADRQKLSHRGECSYDSKASFNNFQFADPA